MKNAHFHLFLVVLIIGFGALGFTSYRTIDFTFSTNVATADSTVIADTQIENGNNQVIPGEEVVVPEVAPAVVTQPAVVQSEPATTVPATPVQSAPAKELTGERKVLADALARLIKDDIRMKIGSSGTRVGTVQKFINMYENKKNPVDNKYGESLKNSVSAFQTASGDNVDGLADPGTYQKMIDWLKAN